MKTEDFDPTPRFELLSCEELIRRHSHKSNRQRGFYFETVGGKDWVTVTWGGYEYDIEMSRISSRAKLLGWVAHLAEKEWAGTTPVALGRFVVAVSQRKGWDIRNI